MAKKKWMDGRLPFLIGYVPSDLGKEIVKSYSGKKLTHYEIATDEKLIRDKQESSAFYYMGGGIVILSLLIALVGWQFDLFNILLISIGLVFCIYAYFAPKKLIILNRDRGFVVFPDWFFMKSHTVPFKDLKIFWAGTGGVSGAVGQRLVTAPPNSSRSIELTLHPGLYDHSWSLMVWYMDRNRPLPP